MNDMRCSCEVLLKQIFNYVIAHSCFCETKEHRWLKNNFKFTIYILNGWKSWLGQRFVTPRSSCVSNRIVLYDNLNEFKNIHWRREGQQYIQREQFQLDSMGLWALKKCKRSTIAAHSRTHVSCAMRQGYVNMIIGASLTGRPPMHIKNIIFIFIFHKKRKKCDLFFKLNRRFERARL